MEEHQVGAGWLVTGSQEAKDTLLLVFIFFGQEKKWEGGLIKDWLRQPCKAATIFLNPWLVFSFKSSHN